MVCSLTMSSSLVNVLAIFRRTSGAIFGTRSQYSPISHRMLARAMGTCRQRKEGKLLCAGCCNAKRLQEDPNRIVQWYCRRVWPWVWWCHRVGLAGSAAASWSPPRSQPPPSLQRPQSRFPSKTLKNVRHNRSDTDFRFCCNFLVFCRPFLYSSFKHFQKGGP